MKFVITDKFEREYQRLNPNQKKAVDTVEGTVMVVAGPGTGKTQILSLRIANILKQTDTAPENILALTFTNAGVFSMRKRLVEIIGPQAYRVNIFTFHSFCENLVNEYGEEYQNLSRSKLISPIEQLQIIEEIIKTGNFKKLKPWGDASFYVNSLPSVFSDFKKEFLTVEGLKNKLIEQEGSFFQREDLYHTKGKWKGQMKGEYKKEEKKLEKNKEVAQAYEEYQNNLIQKRLYDYDDVILETIHTLENNPDFLLFLQEKYQYILVDEHQDTNKSQNRILELLTDFFDRPNLFIVGDEKQAIYRFQGASLENFTFFQKRYKDVLTINLLENYRSTQIILNSAHSLMVNGGKSEKLNNDVKLKSVIKNRGTEINVYPLSGRESEWQFLAEDIGKKIKSGININEIAVFYRNNDEVFAVAKSLEKMGLPFVIESKQDILADTDILKIILLIKTVNNLGDDVLLGKLLFVDFWKIDSLDIYKLMVFSRKNKQGLFDCLKSEELLKEAGIIDKDKFKNIYKQLAEWKKTAMNKDLVICLEELVYQSGYFDYLLKLEDSAEKLHKLNKLFGEAKRLLQEKRETKLSDFVKYLALLENYNLSIQTQNEGLLEGVRLMTAHGAKGLEFDVVYIINMVDKHWGNKSVKNKIKLLIHDDKQEQINDDERRLFFVALTRARQEVNITYAKKKIDGSDQMPSQLLNEIDKKFLKEINSKDWETNFLKGSQRLMMKKKRINADLKNKEYLNKLFLQGGLNVTAVNNYLKCPWEYFFKNLIKAPSAYSKEMVYGNIIHKTLKEFFESFKQGKKTSKKLLLDLFEINLEKSILLEDVKQEVWEKGKLSLDGYYDVYHKDWCKNILNEFNIKGIPLIIKKGQEIYLSGNLDKIEILEGNQVRVIDYKTGKTKSRDEIEGKTSHSDGNYKRQLIFYRLLLDGYNQGQYKMIEGEIDFIEPKDNGKYQKEIFEISDEEIKELKQIIKNISQEILALSFWNKKCVNRDCEFCRLREIMGK